MKTKKENAKKLKIENEVKKEKYKELKMEFQK